VSDTLEGPHSYRHLVLMRTSYPLSCSVWWFSFFFVYFGFVSTGDHHRRCYAWVRLLSLTAFFLDARAYYVFRSNRLFPTFVGPPPSTLDCFPWNPSAPDFSPSLFFLDLRRSTVDGCRFGSRAFFVTLPRCRKLGWL